MDATAYLRFGLALLFVLGLIGLAAFAARRFGFGLQLTPAPGRGRRLWVVDSATVDTKHRLIIVRRDSVEHLVMIGGDRPVVIEAGIPAQTPMPRGIEAQQ